MALSMGTVIETLGFWISFRLSTVAWIVYVPVLPSMSNAVALISFIPSPYLSEFQSKV